VEGTISSGINFFFDIIIIKVFTYISCHCMRFMEVKLYENVEEGEGSDELRFSTTD
jgi:hypothetical protein